MPKIGEITNLNGCIKIVGLSQCGLPPEEHKPCKHECHKKGHCCEDCWWDPYHAHKYEAAPYG